MERNLTSSESEGDFVIENPSSVILNEMKNLAMLREAISIELPRPDKLGLTMTIIALHKNN